MDRRTLYVRRETAEAIATIARRQMPSGAFAVLDTGAGVFAISAKRDLEPVTSWIFDGEFMRTE